jgi:hypothetical protein
VAILPLVGSVEVDLASLADVPAMGPAQEVAEESQGERMPLEVLGRCA